MLQAAPVKVSNINLIALIIQRMLRASTLQIYCPKTDASCVKNVKGCSSFTTLVKFVVADNIEKLALEVDATRPSLRSDYKSVNYS